MLVLKRYYAYACCEMDSNFKNKAQTLGKKITKKVDHSFIRPINQALIYFGLIKNLD